jgi:hypothetical protein
MDIAEIRLKLVEAAARMPAASVSAPDEAARRVMEMARAWEAYVIGAKVEADRAKLGLPPVKK